MASATQRKKATMPFSPAPFTPTPYTPPDFTLPHLAAAPDVTLVPAPKDFVAPEGYHAMSIYPEYLKIAGQWTLARDSRMDCVAVVEGGNVSVREFRHIRAGDLIACGRTENGEEGILVYTDGFRGLATSEDGAPHPGGHDNFAFRLGRSRETAFSRDYDELYELLRHDRDHRFRRTGRTHKVPFLLHLLRCYLRFGIPHRSTLDLGRWLAFAARLP